jgi:hypothetical protein
VPALWMFLDQPPKHIVGFGIQLSFVQDESPFVEYLIMLGNGLVSISNSQVRGVGLVDRRGLRLQSSDLQAGEKCIP